jgi:hypothetical protein
MRHRCCCCYCCCYCCCIDGSFQVTSMTLMHTCAPHTYITLWLTLVQHSTTGQHENSPLTSNVQTKERARALPPPQNPTPGAPPAAPPPPPPRGGGLTEYSKYMVHRHQPINSRTEMYGTRASGTEQPNQSVRKSTRTSTQPAHKRTTQELRPHKPQHPRLYCLRHRALHTRSSCSLH